MIYVTCIYENKKYTLHIYISIITILLYFLGIHSFVKSMPLNDFKPWLIKQFEIVTIIYRPQKPFHSPPPQKKQKLSRVWYTKNTSPSKYTSKGIPSIFCLDKHLLKHFSHLYPPTTLHQPDPTFPASSLVAKESKQRIVKGAASWRCSLRCCASRRCKRSPSLGPLEVYWI